MNKTIINSADLIRAVLHAVVDENVIIDAISTFYEALCAERLQAKEEDLAQTAEVVSKLNAVTNVILASDYIQSLSDDEIDMVRKGLGFDLTRLLCIDAERRKLQDSLSDDEVIMYKHATLKLPIVKWMEAFELANGVATLKNGIADDLVVNREGFAKIFHNSMTFTIPMSKIREIAAEITKEIHLYDGEAYEHRVLRLVELEKQRADLIRAFLEDVESFANSVACAEHSFKCDIETYERAKRLGIQKAKESCVKYKRLTNILRDKTALADLSIPVYSTLIEFAYWCDEIKCYNINILPFDNCGDMVHAVRSVEECEKRRAPHDIDFWLKKFQIEPDDVILFDSLVCGKKFKVDEAAKLVCNEAIFPNFTIEEICDVHCHIAEYLDLCAYGHDDMVEYGIDKAVIDKALGNDSEEDDTGEYVYFR